MRSAIISLLGSLAIAIMVLAMPASALAASVPFYYGGIFGGETLLPCTGFFKISEKQRIPDPQDRTKVIEKTLDYQAVSEKSTDPIWYTDDQGVVHRGETCRSLCDVFILINNLLKFAISVLVTVFTPIMIIIGGFYILISGGNPGYRTTGKKIITGTLIGLAITICSSLIVSQMMTLIFEEEWGQALKSALTVNPGTGIDPSKVEFSWNTLSCRPTQGSAEPVCKVKCANEGEGGKIPDPKDPNPSPTGECKCITPTQNPF